MKKEYESVLVEDLRDQFKAFGEALQMTGERLEANNLYRFSKKH